jgi:hypothetical protein
VDLTLLIVFVIVLFLTAFYIIFIGFWFAVK